MARVLSREAALARDRADPLAARRERFSLPDGLIYLNGNSLGPLPTAVPGHLARVIEQEWGRGLIRSWNPPPTGAGWVEAPRRVAARLAPLIGAAADEVLVADSTSVNLFKLLWAAMRLRPERPIVLAEAGDFPTDHYLAQGLAALDPRRQLRCVPAGEIGAELNERVAVLLLSHVHYRSGARHDLAGLTARAHAVGALTLWDLAHSAGAMPLALSAWGADFAVGCGYKFLNGGPGAPAFLYVARRHQSAAHNPLQGWFGHAHPFAFSAEYEPAPDIGRWQVGTPPILGLAALEAALTVFDGVDLQALNAKSQSLAEVALAWLDGPLAEAGFELLTPRAPEARGSQLSLAHPQAWPLSQALIAEGVIVDFRAPDVLRLGLAPLYLRHVDVYDAMARLHRLWTEGRWQAPRFAQPLPVT